MNHYPPKFYFSFFSLVFSWVISAMITDHRKLQDINDEKCNYDRYIKNPFGQKVNEYVYDICIGSTSKRNNVWARVKVYIQTTLFHHYTETITELECTLGLFAVVHHHTVYLSSIPYWLYLLSIYWTQPAPHLDLQQQLRRRVNVAQLLPAYVRYSISKQAY